MPAFASACPASRFALRLIALTLAAASLAQTLGCAMDAGGAASAGNAPVHVSGGVKGGQQPVSGAEVFLYAASTTANAGNATSLLNGPGYVTTDANGNFSITGDYTCPAGAYVYLLALGGNPGLTAGTNNPAIALAAGLGPCSSLSPSQFITINEVTTVATAYSLASIATSETQIGASSSSTLASAFANVPNLVDTAHGTANSATPTGNGIVPQAKIDSLADALVPCVNSDGSGVPCQNLMSAANLAAGSGLPLDTFQAALSIAKQPTVNVSTIFNQIPATVPFNPTLSSAPGDWTITITYPGTPGYPGVPSVALAPGTATVTQSAQQTLTVTVSNAVATSYLWTTSGVAGSLSEIGGLGRPGQTSFCSTSTQVRYVPTASPAISTETSDSVTVQAFTAPACSAGTAAGTTSSAVTVIKPTSLNGISTGDKTMTVVLPSGVNVPLDQLLVVGGAGTATPASSGSFTIPIFSNGEQILIVLSPKGTPMLMGWTDSNHATISAGTTAEVFAYFALGGWKMLNESDRNEAIADIPSLPGTASLAQLIASQLQANSEAFAQSDAALSNALDQLFISVSGGIVPYATHGASAKPQDVVSNPSASDTQSGLSLITQNPFSAVLSNAYRRRTHAFVMHVKDTLQGQDTNVNAPVADFDVAPASGLSSGVTGAFNDIFQTYFGNQPSAYAPVSTDPFSLPLTSGYDSSTYQIINVGPGLRTNSSVTLTPLQQNQLIVTSVNDFVLDAVLPFVSNALVGSGFMDGNTSIQTGAAGARGPFVLRLETDLLSVLGNVPGEQDKVASGDYKGVLNDLFFGSLSGEFQTSLVDALVAAGGPGTDVAADSKSTIAAKSFQKIMGVAGGVLQIFDSSVLAVQLGTSRQAESWTVTSVPTKVNISPANPTLGGLNYVVLTANVPSVGDTTGYSFQWSIAAGSSSGLIGNLTPNDGSGRQNLTTTFCSSSNQVLYDNTSAAVAALTAPGSDIVSVTVFTSSNCKDGNQLKQSASANAVSTSVTTIPGATVSIDPSYPSINAGSALPMTATYSDASVTPGSYLWTLAPLGTAAGGTLVVNGSAGGSSVCTTSPNITYQSTSTPPLTSSIQDSVVAKAYAQAGCSGTSGNTVLGNFGVAIVTTSSLPIFTVTPNITVNPGTAVTMSASYPLYLGIGAQPTPKSYLWTTTGTYGSLSGGTSYCSTDSRQVYTAAPNASLSQLVADRVTATPYSDTNCTSSQVSGLTATATVNIEPPAGPYQVPSAITSVLQSGDGNYYATALSSCGPNTNNPDTCDDVLRIDPSGAVTTLYTFQLVGSSNACFKSETGQCTNIQGSNLNPLIEGADGNLYGTAKYGGSHANGTIFKIGKDGNYTLLYDFPNGFYGISSGHPRGGAIRCDLLVSGPIYLSSFGSAPGPLVQGADGNFYGTAQGGATNSLATGGGVFFRITPDGSYTVLQRFTYQQSHVTGVYESPCGDSSTYTYSSVYVDPLYFTQNTYNGGSPALVQANDGNFYGMTNLPVVNGSYSYGSPTGSLFQMSPNGAGTVVGSAGALGATVNVSSPLTEGPNNLLYGLGINSSGNYDVFSATTSGTINYIPNLTSTLLGSDGNFYGETLSGSYPPDFTQVTPTGSAVTLGPVTDPDPNNNLTVTGAVPMLESADGNLVGAASGQNNSTNQTTYFVFDDTASSTLKGAVQLSFPYAATPVNRPVTLTWKVFNAFSLTAQQCHATVVDGVKGAGQWSGAQIGAMQGNVYTGTANIVPTAPGTYTYGLTCGGRESGFATLDVQ